jgi:hypothetical protein
MIHLRIPRGLYARIIADLRRPHVFAGERVGFLAGQTVSLSEATLVLFNAYTPVPDDDYIDDASAGATVNSNPIRAAMSRAWLEQCSIFHVHLHAHDGKTGFSKIDQASIPRIIATMCAAAPACAHGMIALSNTHAKAMVWTPEQPSPLVAKRFTIIGFPLGGL